MHQEVRKPIGVAEAIIMTLVAYALLSVADVSLRVAAPQLDKSAMDILAQILGWLATFGIICWRLKTPLQKWACLRLDNSAVVPLAIFASFGAMVLLIGLVPWTPAESPATKQIQDSNTNANWFISGVMIAPIVEEVFFRAWMLGGLMLRYSSWTAILISSLLFGLIHVNPMQVMMTAGMGLIFGWLYILNGSLIPSVVAHATANLTSAYLVGFLLELFGYTEAELSMLNRAPAVLLWTGVIAVAVSGAGLAWVLRHSARATEEGQNGA